MNKNILVILSTILSVLFMLVFIHSMDVYMLREHTSDINKQDMISTEDDSKGADFITENQLLSTGLLTTSTQTIVLVRAAGVPLKPFTAPLTVLRPTMIKSTPKFLLYKTDYLTPIGDQGICGACWVFAVSYVLGDRISIHTKGKVRENLSTQQLLSCFKPDSGCMGNSPEDLSLWLEKSQYDIKSASEYSYKQLLSSVITSTCPVDANGVSVLKGSVKTLTKFIKEEHPNQVVLEDNINRMKTELLENGPFYCAISVYSDLHDFPGNKVYSHSAESSIVGGHAIEIIGYCDSDIDTREGVNGTGYWIARNSWSSDWPSEAVDKGFFAIKMGTNESGIESRAGSCTPDIPKSKDYNISAMRYEDFDDFMKYNKFGMFS